MKKFLFTLALSSILYTAKAQINNLNDLIEVSELSAYGLTSKLQYDWKISQPTEQINGKVVIGRYTYSYPQKKQILQRVIKQDYNTNIKIESTSLVCNDSSLLENILQNLTYKGFDKKTEQENLTLFDDGNILISVQIGSTDEIVLSKGFYRIVIIN